MGILADILTSETPIFLEYLPDLCYTGPFWHIFPDFEVIIREKGGIIPCLLHFYVGETRPYLAAFQRPIAWRIALKHGR